MTSRMILHAVAVLASTLGAGGTLARVPLKDIRANPVALRSVDKDSEEFKSLVDSIRQRGVLSAISVREKTDENGTKFFELIDGLQRFTASVEAGADKDNNPISDIPAQIMSLNDAEVLEAQIIGNIHRIETRPEEYSKQLVRILKANPAMTESELSTKLGKSPTWVNERLGLLKLCPEAAQLVNEGHIGLTNAYSLAKLPKDEQLNWLDRAQTTTPDKFVPEAQNRKKELDKARRAGTEPTPEAFVATPHFRKVADVASEISTMATVTALVNKHSGGDPLVAAKLALQWALNLDADTVALRQAEWETERKQREAEKAQRQLERKEQRAREARERSERINAESAELRASTPAAV